MPELGVSEGLDSTLAYGTLSSSRDHDLGIALDHFEDGLMLCELLT